MRNIFIIALLCMICAFSGCQEAQPPAEIPVLSAGDCVSTQSQSSSELSPSLQSSVSSVVSSDLVESKEPQTNSSEASSYIEKELSIPESSATSQHNQSEQAPQEGISDTNQVILKQPVGVTAEERWTVTITNPKEIEVFANYLQDLQPSVYTDILLGGYVVEIFLTYEGTDSAYTITLNDEEEQSSGRVLISKNNSLSSINDSTTVSDIEETDVPPRKIFHLIPLHGIL